MDVYLYDNDGNIATSFTGSPICDPCTYAVGDGSPSSGPRKIVIELEDVIITSGGFPSGGRVEGFLFVEVHGDTGSVALACQVAPILSGPADLGGPMVFNGKPPCPPPVADVFVFPHLLEVEGGIEDVPLTPNVYDTYIYVVYSGGLGSQPPAPDANVDLYLFNDDGSLMQGASTSPICGPCPFMMGSGGLEPIAPRKRQISIEALIDSSGGFGTATELRGYSMAVVSGSPENVHMSSAVMNIKSSEYDVATFVFEPQVIQATVQEWAGLLWAFAVSTPPPSIPNGVSMRAVPNPSQGNVELAFTLDRSRSIEVDIYDAQGRRVARLGKATYGAGAHALTWDRRGSSGSPVAAGVYFGRLQTSEGSELSRLILLP